MIPTDGCAIPSSMSEHGFDSRDVPREPTPEGDRLQESAFVDAMVTLGSAAAVGSLYYTRAQYRFSRDERDTEYDAIRAEFQAQYEADRRTMDNEYRALYAPMYGLAALDRMDDLGVGFAGFGVE